jgi:predicted nucleotidyltransferase
VKTALTPAEALRRAKRAADHLARDPRVRLVYAFGSAVDPGANRVRDIDVGVWTEPALSGRDLLGLGAALVEAAGGPFDLVSLNRAPVVLAREVAESGVCLYAHPPEMEAEFVTRARARYWDFKPFLELQWRHAGERLEERRRGPQA